ncbi:hypothetical protein ACIBI9_59010 [Nonomuraea sp. NPDC050451]|uniref:hypothetical protein n=1 Tax=Nonomuraea sp. NPDC050451 TaxID=3364364 RepID=UPI0037B8DDB0
MRSVVVVPGGRFGPQAGLLAYVGRAAARRGGALELMPYVLDGMCRPGPLHRSAEVLGRVTTAVEAFLDDVVWR